MLTASHKTSNISMQLQLVSTKMKFEKKNMKKNLAKIDINHIRHTLIFSGCVNILTILAFDLNETKEKIIMFTCVISKTFS